MFLLTGGVPQSAPQVRKKICVFGPNQAFPTCKVRSGVQGEKLWISVDTEIQFQNSDVD